MVWSHMTTRKLHVVTYADTCLHLDSKSRLGGYCHYNHMYSSLGEGIHLDRYSLWWGHTQWPCQDKLQASKEQQWFLLLWNNPPWIYYYCMQHVRLHLNLLPFNLVTHAEYQTFISSSLPPPCCNHCYHGNTACVCLAAPSPGGGETHEWTCDRVHERIPALAIIKQVPVGRNGYNHIMYIIKTCKCCGFAFC